MNVDQIRAIGLGPATDRLSRPERVVGIILAVWFGLISLLVLSPQIYRGAPVGWDAVVYTEAARNLLSGVDPWVPTSNAIGFAAPPPSLLPYVPFAWLPDPAVGPLWVAVAAVCAVYSVRRLGLPMWWLLFPPIAHGIATGGTALPVLALLVRGGTFAEAAAVTIRVYAAIPMVVLGHWRSIAAAFVVIAVTSPFLAWPTFLNEYGQISERLVLQASGGSSVAGVPILVPIAVIALLLLGRPRAAWLAVPVLWPSTQLYYAVIAVPALASAPLVAVGLAVPGAPLAVAVGVASQAAFERVLAWIRPRKQRIEPLPPSDPI